MNGLIELTSRVFLPASRALVKALAFRTSCKAGFVLAGLFVGSVHGATLMVPSNFSSIQAAINAAANGDSVLVAAGTYFENINFSGKAITVSSELGAANTIIDGNASNSVVTFASGEGPNSTLRGFTLRNGRASFNGGGVLIQNSSPTILDNVITGNQACSGSGVSVSFGSPLIQSNNINSNSQAGCSGGTGGGGVYIGGNGSARLIGNIIASNTVSSADGGGVSLFAAGTPTLQGNVIQGNSASGISPCARGGGIAMANVSDALIVGNLITGNSAGCGGGIAWLVPSGAIGPLLVNNTIADNSSASGSGIFADGYDGRTRLINNLIIGAIGQSAVVCGNFNDTNTPVFQNNDVFTLQGTAFGGICAIPTGSNGNISADPLFVAPANANYHLQAGSPAIDIGLNSAPSLPVTDLDGNVRIADGNGDGNPVVDLGVYESQPALIYVTIDIKPGNYPNIINPTKKGMVPVAIFSTAAFNVPSQVVTASLKFGRTGSEPSLASCSSPQDLNGDGRLDLLCQFSAQKTGFQSNDTKGMLTGMTIGGTPISGTDSVVINGGPK